MTIQQHPSYASHLQGNYDGRIQKICAAHSAGRVLKNFLELGGPASQDVVTIQIREVCRWDFGEPGEYVVPDREDALYFFVCSDCDEDFQFFTEAPEEEGDDPETGEYNGGFVILLPGAAYDAVRRATGRLTYAGKQLALLEITEVGREDRHE